MLLLLNSGVCNPTLRNSGRGFLQGVVMAKVENKFVKAKITDMTACPSR